MFVWKEENTLKRGQGWATFLAKYIIPYDVNSLTEPARFLDTETKGDVEAMEGEPVRLACEAIGFVHV